MTDNQINSFKFTMALFILFFGAGFLIGLGMDIHSSFNAEYKTTMVDCYDRDGSKILGQTCSKQELTGQTYYSVLPGVLLVLFAFLWLFALDDYFSKQTNFFGFPY